MGGLLTFVLIVVILFWMARLSSRMKAIEQKLGAGAVVKPVQPMTQTAQAPVQPITQPVQAAPQPTAPVKPAFELNAESASGLLTKVGVVALLFGMAFFLKYAIDQGWISVWGRLILGFAVGGLFIVLGEIWKKKYVQYSQALTGGGIAILYFTVYAAYQFYNVMDQSGAFLIMVIITVMGVLLAYRYDSKWLGALAVVGGYLSPVLIHSTQDKQVALFTYLTLLNVGVVLMLMRRYWYELLLLLLFGAGLDYALWADTYSKAANTLNSIIFLSLNLFLVFILSALVFRKAHEKAQLTQEISNYVGAFYFLAVVGFFGATAILLNDNFHDYLAPIMLLGGIICYITYVVIDRLEYSGVNYCLSLAGSWLLVAAVLWQFSGQTENLYLLALAVVGIGAGLMQRRKDIRIWGLIILVAAIVKILFSSYDLTNYQFLLNAKMGTEVVALAVLLLTAWAYGKHESSEDEKLVPELMRLFASGLVWLAGSLEISAYFRDSLSDNVANLLLSVWWMVLAVVLAALGAMKRYTDLRKAAAVLFVITILKVFLYDVQALELGYRIVSFIVLGVILLGVSFAYQRNKEKIQQFLGGAGKGEHE